jgi:hypothetical protein
VATGGERAVDDEQRDARGAHLNNAERWREGGSAVAGRREHGISVAIRRVHFSIRSEETLRGHQGIHARSHLAQSEVIRDSRGRQPRPIK